MKRSREKIQYLYGFLKFLSVHYGNEFADELNDLQCAVNEIEIDENDIDKE